MDERGVTELRRDVLDLDLSVLPRMAQERTISWLATAIWADARVVALPFFDPPRKRA